jgi:hypothetical protein
MNFSEMYTNAIDVQQLINILYFSMKLGASEREDDARRHRNGPGARNWQKTMDKLEIVKTA